MSGLLEVSLNTLKSRAAAISAETSRADTGHKKELGRPKPLLRALHDLVEW
jgi:hypothetical protein